MLQACTDATGDARIFEWPSSVRRTAAVSFPCQAADRPPSVLRPICSRRFLAAMIPSSPSAHNMGRNTLIRRRSSNRGQATHTSGTRRVGSRSAGSRSVYALDAAGAHARHRTSTRTRASMILFRACQRALTGADRMRKSSNRQRVRALSSNATRMLSSLIIYRCGALPRDSPWTLLT